MVIDGKTGFVVEPRSSKSIADAIIEYYGNDLEKEFSGNVAEEKKKYSWEEFITNIMKLVDASKN